MPAYRPDAYLRREVRTLRQPGTRIVQPFTIGGSADQT